MAPFPSLETLRVFEVACRHGSYSGAARELHVTRSAVSQRIRQLGRRTGKFDGEIRHFWGSEMSFAPTVPNQHHRAGDLVDPLWGLLDMTPEGRSDFFPKENYD